MDLNKKKIIGITGLLTILLVIFATGQVFGVDPGSSTDPLVSKSYVDSLFQQLSQQINGQSENNTADSDEETERMSDEAIGTLMDLKIQEALKDVNGNSSNESSTGGVQEKTYTVIEVEADQTVIGAQGTEMILRGGKALAVGVEDNGLQDVTAGIDVKDGQDIEANHLFIIPRNDGRGMKILKHAWIMIKGNYIIQ